MSLYRFFTLCLCLITFYPREVLGRPSKEDGAAAGDTAGSILGGPKRERRCRVTGFEVQSNFQIESYIGTWYHIAHIQALDFPYQRRSHYSLLEDGTGSGLSMRTQRIARNCHVFEFNAVGRQLDPVNTPAKMELSVPMRPLLRDDYWVLYTDYQNMAVIYSCSKVALSGLCRAGAAKLWVIGRTTQLTSSQLQHVHQLVEGVCMDPADLQMITSDCDSSLGIVPVTMQTEQTDESDKPDGFTHSCVVDDFPVQNDFNVEKYLGTWYTVAHVEPSTYPYPRKSIYSLNEDGSIFMAAQRVSRDGQCNSWVFEAIGYLPEGSSNPAKLLLNVTGIDMPPEDYWILYVNYDAYAVVYSCGERSADGTCNDAAEHAWVMSRRLSLSELEKLHVMQVLEDVCIGSSRLEDIPTDCDDDLNLSADTDDKDDEMEEIISTEEIEISCLVDDLQVQEDFVVEKFLGEWYSIKHKNPTIFKQQTSFRSMVFAPSEDKASAHIDVLIQDIKLGAQCGLAENQVGLAWVSDTQPAKFSVSFQTVSDNGQTDSGGWNFWIVATDYTNYAVAYACHVTLEINTCDPNAEELWVLSRTPSLDLSLYQYNIENAVQYVCMEPSDLVDNGEPCLPAANIKVKQDKLKYTKPAGPSDLRSKRLCDPALTTYGCCLLEDKPADGPNYEGCPRAPPPIAGQPLPGEPQEITDPGECDDKIRCKMWCEYGFATDVNGCEICKCATEPQPVLEVAAASVNPPQLQQRWHLTECEQQRKFMLEYLKQTGQTSDYYLPSCDISGLFERTQCYAGTNTCWCVEPATGSVTNC